MNVVSRAEWRARPPKQPYTALAGSQGIAVHHAGDGLPAPATLDQAAAKARATQNYHMDTKGWNDIAYGWLVAAGRVFEGRGWGWIDGADTGPGRLMHSVCWLGDSTAHPVSDADLAAIASVIAEHQARYGDLPVVGHGQINATDCPGDRLDAWLAAGRPTTPQPEEDDVTPDDIEAVAKRVTAYLADPQTNPGTIIDSGARNALGAIHTVTADPTSGIRTLVLQLLGRTSGSTVDPVSLAAAIADSLGDDLARAVADELGKRLAS